jgi:hypothetical protein
MLQSAVPILWPWKSEPLHPRSRCRPRPYFHASTKAGLRIARPGLWTAVGIWTPLAGESPVLQYSHIRDVLIWKSGTLLARSSHAVSPRIPTSPQQTTTAAIYTYLFMYSVVVLAVWAAAPCGVGHPVCSLWSLTRGLVSASDDRGHFAPTGLLGTTPSFDKLRAGFLASGLEGGPGSVGFASLPFVGFVGTSHLFSRETTHLSTASPPLEWCCSDSCTSATCLV